MIDSFRGPTFFLSNYYEAPVIFEGIRYGSSEAAFQAQKRANYEDRKAFANMTPDESKKAGRSGELRPDWEDVKVDLMKQIVYHKFMQNPALAVRLLETGDEELVEGNTWGDRIWGKVDGEGQNLLGKILMEVREEIRNKKDTL